MDLKEIHQFCIYFFLGKNNKGSSLPDPSEDWTSFMHSLKKILKNEKLQYNPVKKKMTAWMSLSKLENMFGPARQRENTQTPKDSSSSSQQHNHHHRRAPVSKDLTLETVLQQWSHQPPKYKRLNPLHHLLVTIVDVFPPTNTKVEYHEYFSKWMPISTEAFSSESGDELNELLKRGMLCETISLVHYFILLLNFHRIHVAMRKTKLFLHPDKLPIDLTENQSSFFRTLWDVILESEEETLK